MASSELGENFGETYQKFREIQVKKRDTFHSPTPLQDGSDYQNVKRKKRRKKHSKHSPSTEMTAKRISRTALDTMRLRTIRKIPSMSTFTWQHISEVIETQMSKMELEETSTSVETEVQEVYDTEQKSDSNYEHTTFKKGHRKVNIKNQEKRKHKKKSQKIVERDEKCSPWDNSKSWLENNRPRVQKSEYQALDTSLTNDGLHGNTVAVDGPEGEEQSKGKNRNTCKISEITKLSLQGTDSHSKYVHQDVTNSVKGNMPYTLRTSTKRPGKKNNHVRFKVRLPPVNVGRKEPVVSHSVGKETPQVSHRQAYALPKLLLPGNLTLKTFTVNDTRSSFEFTKSNSIGEDERGVFQNQEPKEIVKKKRSQSAVFKRFREYYSKRPHVTVS